MSKRLTQLRIQLLIASAVWFAVVGWFAIVQIPASALYTKESPEVQDRMEVECTGTYQQRYDCKNMVAIEVTNHSLMQVTIRIALLIAGPSGAFYYFRMMKRREPPPPPPPVVHDDMSWKNAAKDHIKTSKGQPQSSEPFSLDKL